MAGNRGVFCDYLFAKGNILCSLFLGFVSVLVCRSEKSDNRKNQFSDRKIVSVKSSGPLLTVVISRNSRQSRSETP